MQKMNNESGDTHVPHQPDTRIRALVVDDDQEFLETAGRLLAGHEKIHVVGRFHSGMDVLPHILATEPHVIFCGLAMRELHGLHLARRVKQFKNPAKVFIVTHQVMDGESLAMASDMGDEKACDTGAVLLGADGLVFKHRFHETLNSIIEKLIP
jgi:CheY-like chemotaxis protein